MLSSSLLPLMPLFQMMHLFYLLVSASFLWILGWLVFISYNKETKSLSCLYFSNLSSNKLQDTPSPNRTLDLASALEVGPTGNRASGDNASNNGNRKSVMTIAFQFAFEMHLQESVTAMARQYVRSIIASVQRVALALSPSNFGSHAGFRPPPGSPEAQTLARWICQSYRWVI